MWASHSPATLFHRHTNSAVPRILNHSCCCQAMRSVTCLLMSFSSHIHKLIYSLPQAYCHSLTLSRSDTETHPLYHSFTVSLAYHPLSDIHHRLSLNCFISHLYSLTHKLIHTLKNILLWHTTTVASTHSLCQWLIRQPIASLCHIHPLTPVTHNATHLLC